MTFHYLPNWDAPLSGLTVDSLLSLAACGFDVMYFLTGRRTKELTTEEEVLMNNYKKMSKNNQAVFSRLAMRLRNRREGA
jgi:hypothetical protein